MLEYSWTRTHLPSGKRWRVTGKFESPLDFYRTLNRWNVHGKGEWLYTTNGNIGLGPIAPCWDIRSDPQPDEDQ